MFNFQDFKSSLTKIVEKAKQEIALLRTGEANVKMLDPVQVEVYGSQMSIS